MLFTFPYEIICGTGKTREDVQKKAETKPKIIHPYQRQRSQKMYQPIFKAALFDFNCILFTILLTENIPKPHSDAFNLVVMNGPKR